MQLGPIGETLRACLKRHPVETLQGRRLPDQQRPVRGRPAHPGRLHLHADLRRPAASSASAPRWRTISISAAARPASTSTPPTSTRKASASRPPATASNATGTAARFERLVTANVRVPDLTIGDFNAQFAANAIGVLRVKQLCERYGVDKVEAAMAEMQDYSERRVRAAIAQAPKGTFHGEDAIDDDGLSDDPLVDQGQGHDRRRLGRDRLRGHLRRRSSATSTAPTRARCRRRSPA